MAKSEPPGCCGRTMTPIVYGVPGREMWEAAERGEIRLGGCVVEEHRPTFVCQVCGRAAGRLGDVCDQHFDYQGWS